jgi:hypothetical protein
LTLFNTVSDAERDEARKEPNDLREQLQDAYDPGYIRACREDEEVQTFTTKFGIIDVKSPSNVTVRVTDDGSDPADQQPS